MAKWSKKLLGLAAIGSAAAGLVYYFKKSKKEDADDFNDDFEDEDFDLDNDLQPVDRGYVNLNASKESASEDVAEPSDETASEETKEAEETEETASESEEDADAASAETEETPETSDEEAKDVAEDDVD